MMQHVFMTDANGQQYEARLDYDKDPYRGPRGYYATIRPVDLEDCNGFYSFTYSLSYSPNYVKECLLSVTRASKKAAAEAVGLFDQLIIDYCRPRQIVQMGSISDAIAYANAHN